MKLILVALLTGTALAVQAAEIRRIALDGTPLTILSTEILGTDGFPRIKMLEQPGLELFPASAKPTRGTVLICPGGGYAGLAVGHEGREVAKMLNEAGWDASVLLYHVSAGERTRELALGDAKAALALIQTRGADFGLASHRIGVMGFSAGGHLSARLVHETAKDKLPAFVALIYPAYLEAEGKCLDEVAPANVPAFLYVAQDDKHAPGSFAYAAACKDRGTRSEFFHPDEGGHGFGLKPTRPASVQDWPDKLLGFLGSLD